MTSNIFHVEFGGEPIESHDGESVEGVDPYGETQFTSGTIYTDKLFTGQRDILQSPPAILFPPPTPAVHVIITTIGSEQQF